jgi:chromosome segregation ATPase
MKERLLRLAVALVALGLPGVVAAQGLGDTAARERERREKEKQAKQGEAAPVYTDHDLDAIRPPDADDDSEEDDDATASRSSGGSGREERPSRPGARIPGRDDPLRPYQDELSNAQAEVDRIEDRMRELSGKLNPMSRDYIYGAAQSVDAAGEELRIKAELNELEGRLIEARQELAAATESMQAAREGREPTPPTGGELH